MDIQLAKRVKRLSPSPTMAVTAKAKELKAQGHHVIELGAGEPEANTPRFVIEAAYQAMLEGKTKYTQAGGIPELKDAIIERFQKDHGLHYTRDQIIVTAGAKHALYNLFQVLLNPGDEVLIPSPYWVSYPEQVKLAEGEPIFLEGREEFGFKITAEQVQQAITPRTKAIILNSPSNPTGMMYTEEEMRKIGRVAIDNNIWIVADDIYEKLVFDHTHTCIATLGTDYYEKTIVINGVSKPYAMTGWRIGYAAGNKTIIKAMSDLSSHSTSNPTSISQYAAIAALTGDQSSLEEMRKTYHERRDLLHPLINEIEGFQCQAPQGAFYFYINIEKAMKKGNFATVDDWAAALLEEEKVAVVPGTGFGTNQHIRISFAGATEELLEAIARMKRFVEKER